MKRQLNKKTLMLLPVAAIALGIAFSGCQKKASTSASSGGQTQGEAASTSHETHTTGTGAVATGSSAAAPAAQSDNSMEKALSTSDGSPTGESHSAKAGAPSTGTTVSGQTGNGNTQSTTVSTPAEPAKPERTCLTIAYKHKSLPSHMDGEACTHHKNLLKIKNHELADLNPKSICVRVNGTPVHFEKAKEGLMIGPIAGPSAKITARFCLGKATCAEDCTVPKDEFMSAIGADGADAAAPAKGQKAAHWDPNDANEGDKDATAEIDTVVQRELASLDELTIFQDWISEDEVAACGTHVAGK